MSPDFVRACWLSLALTIGIGYVAAPVPKTRMTADEMVGRWQWRINGGAPWHVWLDRGGDYRAAVSPDAVEFFWVGRWWVDNDRLYIEEWATSNPQCRTRHELPRGALFDKTALEGSRD